MLGDQSFGNFVVPSGNQIGGVLESEINKKTDPCSILVFPCSDQKQDALYNAAPNCPKAVILKPKKPAHYKRFSGPKEEYLYSKRCVPVQVAINNPGPGLELSIMLKYKALTHQREAVQACHEHFNIKPAESKGMDLRTPNKAAFVLMAGCSCSVQYELDGLHPMARVTLNADAEWDVMNLVFLCLSSCKPHKNCGDLMLLHLNIRDINTGVIVSSSVFTVRVATNTQLARAFKKYEEDMLGRTTPRRPAKRPMTVVQGLDNVAEVVDVVAKNPKLEHGNERKDNASDVVDVVDSELNQDCEERDNTSGVVDIVMDHSEVNHDGEGCEDTSDIVEMADYIFSCDLFAKEAVERMMADIAAGTSSSTPATDDNCNKMNGMGSASNQLPLFEARSSTNNSTVNIGATSGISQDSMVRSENLPLQIENNQTSMVPIANNAAVTVTNQNQTPAAECSLNSSTSLDFSNTLPVLSQEYAASDAVAFVVTGLINPENDCHKIKQYVESLGASCSQASLLY